jgi:ABC-type dipeptide/oligopeptide/nickel transport system ATPase component/ABC-type dipeptide/oligopeptide/nickel transport system permease subunit
MTLAPLDLTQRRPRLPALRLHPVQSVGISILFAMFIAVVIGPILVPYGAHDYVCAAFESPSFAHPLGCNDAGQDLLAGVLIGGRISLGVGIVTALLTTSVATAIAIAAAYRGGWTDQIAMRAVDVVMSLPFLPLVIVLGAFLGASLPVQVLVISLVMWAQPVRELRAQALSLRNSDYVKAARGMGAGFGWIARHHILPDLASLIVPQFVRIAHSAILIESSLSFLGLGDPLRKSWGTILFHANARTAFLTDAWVWWIMPPGAAIALVITAFALVGYGVGGNREITAPADAIPPTVIPKPNKALIIDDVSIAYYSRNKAVTAVSKATFNLDKGELIGLVGESGSGKSTLGMALLGLLPRTARIASGAAWMDNQNLLAVPPEILQTLRGRKIAVVPQSAMNALNPVRSIGWQIAEALRIHGNDARKAQVARLLDLVRIPTDRAGAYPHELSGGMRQRVVIAISLANNPDVLIADEPTTGLDVLVQAEIMELLADLRLRLGIAMLFITHDLPLISHHADRLAIMLNGEIVETGTPSELIGHAQHKYTRALFAAIPQLEMPKAWDRPISHAPVVLSVRDASFTYNSSFAARLRGAKPVEALRDVSLDLRAGEVLG